MSPQTFRLIGILFMVAAVITAVMNLRRVANLGMGWLPALFIVVGIAFIITSRRRM